MEAAKHKVWHKGSLGDEDDARTSNTRVAQRKRAIPHSTMKHNRRRSPSIKLTSQRATLTSFVITLIRGRHILAS